MDAVMDVLGAIAEALLSLVAAPYLYIAVLFVWWQARQGNQLQRRLFHVRLRASLAVAGDRLLAGLAAGAALSAAGFGLGAGLSADTVVCAWIATAVLALLRLRFVCLAYAAGALGVVRTALAALPADGLNEPAASFVRTLAGIDAPSLLLLAGLLHVAEGWLVRRQGARHAVPLFTLGKRGKPMGAYALSGAWPVPLLWLVPAAGTGAGGFELPWTPLLGLGAHVSAWSLAAFPVLIGFSDRTETRWPEQAARWTGNRLLLYGGVLTLAAAAAFYWRWAELAASLLAIVLHEGLLLWSRLREAGRPPAYAQNGRGVTVLAVLPGTPADEMGLLPGEVIVKVNGMPVRDKEALHAALQLQPAFCKLEVLNREGHVKFAQRARYAGEHYQLGIILAPDDDADYVVVPRADSLWRQLRQAGARRRRGAALPAGEAGAGPELAAAAEEQAAAAEGANAAGEAAPAPAEAGGSGPAPAPAEPGLPPRRARRR